MSDFEYLKYIKMVGQKEYQQFQRAIKNPLTHLETEIRNNLIDDATYYPISDRANCAGRNHHVSLRIANDKVALCDNSLFANRLVRAEAIYEKGKAPYYPCPSERVTFGGLHFYTFEFDQKDVEFFRTQVSWVRGAKRPDDCAMGRLFQSCSQYTDFRGITVCWSGHKSLHIHIVFDTAPYITSFGQPVGEVRHALIANWQSLETAVIDKLGLAGSELRPDRLLQYPEQYRRLPNGNRIVGDGHLLGIPAGTFVQQTTLWEKWRDRAAPQATGLFHLPTSFAPRPDKVQSRSGSATRHVVGQNQYSAAEIAYCEARLREIYPDTGWPKLAHLKYESGVWKAMFHNSAADRNPSTVIHEAYASILFAGKDSDGLSAVSLPATLGEMMKRWATVIPRFRACTSCAKSAISPVTGLT